MPTARELLEQADALMRRNRKRGKRKDGGPPTLTDALGIDRRPTLAPTIILPDQPPANADAIALPGQAESDPMALDTLSDLPVLTDVVDVWPGSDAADVAKQQSAIDTAALDAALEADALAAKPAAFDAAEGLDALAAKPAAFDAAEGLDATAEEAATRTAAEATPVRIAALGDSEVPRAMPSGEAPRVAPAAERDVAPTVQVAKEPVLEEEFILDIPPADDDRENVQPVTLASPHAVAEPAPAVVPGSVDWNAMAEEIRMQVLQRLDLFTDTGLRDQLGARLQPIVDRAAAELVETINHQLGELVRGYVAEAIEREIESWRTRGT
jgi:hypothetical protein